MAWFSEDRGDAFDRPGQEDPGFLFDLWPSDTSGSGRVKKNNKITGGYQGKSSFKRKAACLLCGYVNDLNKVDHSGGSIDGDGAGGGITKSTTTFTLTNGTSVTEKTGDQSLRKFSGCSLCFSRNSSSEFVDLVDKPDPIAIPPLGF